MINAQPSPRRRALTGVAAVAVTIAAGGIGPASGQTVTGVVKLPSIDIETQTRNGAAGVAGALWSGRGWRMIVVRRTDPGEVEVHAVDDDLFVVRSGEARVTVGGTVDGDRETAPNERRGGQIKGGATVRLGPGDQLLIAAGVPHQVHPEGGAFEYLVVKAAGPTTGRRP